MSSNSESLNFVELWVLKR